MAGIDYSFRDPALLRLALSHRSSGRNNNERLEFLGDSILGFIVAEALYHRFPDLTEGELSRLRAGLIKKSTLAAVARELALGERLILGSGELKSGGARRESILADAVEAVICAIYLDGGLEVCRQQVLQWFDGRLNALEQARTIPGKDPKTRLQEFLQAVKADLPVYELKEVAGEDHRQFFFVHCHVGMLAEPVPGEGASRREAEQVAAERALTALNAGGG